MNSKKSRSLCWMVSVVALLTSCASHEKRTEEPAPVVSQQVPPAAPASAPQQAEPAPSDKLVANPLPNVDALDHIVYFDFDSFIVKADYRPVIEAHAAVLRSDTRVKEVVEGYTDERGGAEYNLALGQKRADAVVSQLKTLGVSDSQLEAISYGKERPAVDGHDENAWAKNRRAVLRGR